MPEFKVFATNQPDLELTVDESELLDLARQGLLVPGKGDIDRKGRLKGPAAETFDESSTGSLPAITSDPSTTSGA